MLPTVFKTFEKRYKVFPSKKFSKDRPNSENCLRYDQLVIGLVSYNLGSNRARNFKSKTNNFRNYSRNYSLNCTPDCPITITNKL